MNIIFITQKFEDSKEVQSFVKELFFFLKKDINKNIKFIINSFENKKKYKHVYYLQKSPKFHFLSKFFKLFNLYKVLFNLNSTNKIDIIYVHQLSIFVLALIPFRILGIKIYLWRAHTHENLISFLSYIFADKLFSTNTKTIKILSFIRYKYNFVGQMINTKKFTYKDINKKFNNKLIYIGRITKIKNFDEMLEYLIKFNTKYSKKLTLDIYGPLNYTKYDLIFYKSLREKITNKNMDKYIFFKGPINRNDFLKISKNYFFNINFSNGALDKSILELIYLNTIPLVKNNSFKYSFSEVDKAINNFSDFEKKILFYSKLDNKSIKDQFRLYKNFIDVNHSMQNNFYKTFLL